MNDPCRRLTGDGIAAWANQPQRRFGGSSEHSTQTFFPTSSRTSSPSPFAAMADQASLLSSFPAEVVFDTAQSRQDYNQRARTFVQNVTKLPKSALVKDHQTPQDPLEVRPPLELQRRLAYRTQALSPSTHSLAWLYVLCAHTGEAVELPTSVKAVPESFRPQGHLWKKTVLFFRSFDPVQVRYAGHEWRRLVEYVERSATLSGEVRAEASDRPETQLTRHGGFRSSDPHSNGHSSA